VLSTYSGHRLLEPNRRSRLHDALVVAIDAVGGHFERQYTAVLLQAPRQPR
jgi:hypothetical protein